MGNGNKINVARDAQIYKGANQNIEQQLIVPVVTEAPVASLIQADRRWDESYIRHIVNSSTTDDIMKVPIPVDPCEDIFIWPNNKEGKLTVKSYTITFGN